MPKTSSTCRLHKEWFFCSSKCFENEHAAGIDGQSGRDFRGLPTGPDIALISGQSLLRSSA
jgi:hypothetical protein